jgi:hypothetical protein
MVIQFATGFEPRPLWSRRPIDLDVEYPARSTAPPQARHGILLGDLTLYRSHSPATMKPTSKLVVVR